MQDTVFLEETATTRWVTCILFHLLEGHATFVMKSWCSLCTVLKRSGTHHVYSKEDRCASLPIFVSLT